MVVFELIASMNEEEPDKTTLKTDNRNRNEENRRQIIDFIADNVISDAKTISKAIGLKPSRARDYLKQLVDERFLAKLPNSFGQMGERKKKKRYFQANCHIKNGKIPS